MRHKLFFQSHQHSQLITLTCADVRCGAISSLIKIARKKNSPTHVFPLDVSIWSPGSHEHSTAPGTFLHLCSQPPLSVSHSSISAKYYVRNFFFTPSLIIHIHKQHIIKRKSHIGTFIKGLSFDTWQLRFFIESVKKALVRAKHLNTNCVRLYMIWQS